MKTRISVLIVAAAVLCSTLAASRVAQGSALLIGTPAGGAPWSADVQSKIEGTGLISGNVDVFDATAATPTLAQLDNYSSVLVYSDVPFSDPTDLSNTLADYVDQGHNVVVATFALTNNAIGLDSGRLLTGGYLPYVEGPQSQEVELTLGTVLVPSSPLVAGVHSFDGGSSSYYDNVSLVPGSQLVADWSNGVPLIADNVFSKGSVVGLNFYPVSSDQRSDFWLSSTDGATILADALNFNSTPVPEPTSLAIAAGALCLLKRPRKSTAAAI
jgi:hypothetical protein